jgi:hypothetical protein
LINVDDDDDNDNDDHDDDHDDDHVDNHDDDDDSGGGDKCWGLYNCLDRYSKYLRTFEYVRKIAPS